MRTVNGTGEFITLKDEHWFRRQKLAGEVVARCLATSRQLILDQTPSLSLKDIEAHCLKIIKDHDCDPTFLGYKGFPGSVCLSVNEQLVHGIPNDYILQPGDVVKLDLGATYEGAIADAAISAIYGEPRSEQHVKLVEKCQQALYTAIDSIEIGKRMGCIGNAIHRFIYEGLFYSHFKLINNYGGHGLDYNKPHAQPFVPNKSDLKDGIIIRPGLTFAIEPMLAIGSYKTTVLSDGWTVATPDVSVHWEHTIFVGEDKIHVMTQWENLDENNI